ncbi:unnamed protein product, partial [Rotaria sp. Silwood2]
ILDIDENDFYQVLNIHPNATQIEIRNAYLKRALEWHPDRNIDSTIQAKQLFQALRRAYEILSNETGRKEYNANTDIGRDDDKDDDFLFEKSNLAALHMGPKMSDIYRTQIDEYITNYESLTFVDNFSEKIKEILERFTKDTEQITNLDNYVQCNVCYQSSLNNNVHQGQNVESYEKFFNDSTSIKLEQIIDQSIWNWKSVVITTKYLSLWNNSQRWNLIKPIIEQISIPIEIVRQSSNRRFWTRCIDKYECEKEKLYKLPELLSCICSINVLPNSNEVDELKQIFDKYDQDEEGGVLTKLHLVNDQRTTTGGNYCLVDPSTKNKYIDIDQFRFPIENPPPFMDNASQCNACKRVFTLLHRRHTCRMCSEQHCAECLSFKRIPHLGYIAKPVRICRKCSCIKQSLLYEHLFNYVQQLIESNRIQYLNVYLALINKYEPNGDETFYRQVGDRYFDFKQYSLALQCFIYSKMNNDDWFRYSIDLCAKK